MEAIRYQYEKAVDRATDVLLEFRSTRPSKALLEWHSPPTVACTKALNEVWHLAHWQLTTLNLGGLTRTIQSQWKRPTASRWRRMGTSWWVLFQPSNQWICRLQQPVTTNGPSASSKTTNVGSRLAISTVLITVPQQYLQQPHTCLLLMWVARCACGCDLRFLYGSSWRKYGIKRGQRRRKKEEKENQENYRIVCQTILCFTPVSVFFFGCLFLMWIASLILRSLFFHVWTMAFMMWIASLILCSLFHACTMAVKFTHSISCSCSSARECSATADFVVCSSLKVSWSFSCLTASACCASPTVYVLGTTCSTDEWVNNAHFCVCRNSVFDAVGWS